MTTATQTIDLEDDVGIPAEVEYELAAQLDDRDPIQRLVALCQRGSFSLREQVDGAVYGVGLLDGVSTVVFATDPQVQGGALGVDSCALIVRAYQFAIATDAPIVGVWQSGGARLKEGARSLHAVGYMFAAMTRASGTIPQVSLVLGPAAGGAAYGPALTDVVIMGPDARVLVTGPDVVRSVTGEDLTAEELGGPALHGRISGVAHVTARSNEEAADRTRAIVKLLNRGPSSLAVLHNQTDPASVLPETRRRAYDVHPLIDALLDGPGEELQREFAPNIVTMLGRLHGRTVGVVANNPIRLGGCLTSNASDKAARFVRLCDAFGIPLVVVVDVPGYLPGSRQERDGVVRRGAKLLHAFAAASVPRVTVITRKAFGGAYIAMNSTSLGATQVFAWPDAEVDVMNPVAAIRVLHRRQLAELEGDELDQVETELATSHNEATGGLARAVDDGLIDSILEPIHTRDAIAAAIRSANSGRGRHTNIPL